MWRIFYNDREPYSSEDGGPETAPARGVQVIVQTHREYGVELLSSSDYYVWRDDRWWGTDINGLWDYLCMDGWKVVLFGRMILQAEYNEIIRQAGIIKDVWHKRERRTATDD